MKKILSPIVMIFFLITSFLPVLSQTNVNSLLALRSAVLNSNQEIIMQAGSYNLEELPSDSRNIICTGSNNTINLSGVYINVPIGSVDTTYFFVTGNNNTVIGGEFEDTYRNGLTEITDFVAYNIDRDNLAHGLRGAAVMDITGNDNLINGIKLTVRGSYPYGYGSMYGINQYNTFGLDKRCGLLVTGIRNTLDNVEIQQRAFGHAIYMQGDADETVVKNSLVEGRVRAYAELYDETDPNALPYRSDYKLPETSATEYNLPLSSSALPIPTDDVFSMAEDGIRAYNNTGSVTVENCIVKKTRGGIRLYLGSDGTVTNSTAIDCGMTNYNLPNEGTITNSSGNFSYGPLSDFRLGRSNMDIEITIIPSPNTTGSHNLADVQGNNHNITFHRTPGPIDTNLYPIAITGNNSTIVNETEYPIILDESASGNSIISCATVTDNGSSNTITYLTNCAIETSNCENYNALDVIEAENYCNQYGIQKNSENTNVGWIENGDWIMFEKLNFESGANSITANISSETNGGNIEIRQGSTSGIVLGILNIPNTGSWTSWEIITTNISETNGEQDIYLVFTGSTGYLFDIDWFKFENKNSLTTDDFSENLTTKESQSYPNPFNETITIPLYNQENIIVKLIDISGRLILKKEFTNTNTAILENLGKLDIGMYLLQIYDSSNKIIKSKKLSKS